MPALMPRGGEAPPLLLTESRSLHGVLRNLAYQADDA